MNGMAVGIQQHVEPNLPSTILNLRQHIRNVVVLCMENRSVYNLLGGQRIPGLDNPVNNGPFCNPMNLSDPSQGQVCSQARDYDSVSNDPDHEIHGNNIQFYGTFNPNNRDIANGKLKPSQSGFVHEQIRLYRATNVTVLGEQVMNYYTEDQPTDPNRAFLTSGTSAGHGTNDAGFHSDVHALTQKSIFQHLSETNRTWANYCSDKASMVDAYYYNWTFASGNQDKVQPMGRFYEAAKSGTLPEFTYIDPDCCHIGTNSMHPSGLISDGEWFIKRIYEALRSSPQWEQTLFLVTFDETGGFHDHVPAPLAIPPDDLTYTGLTPDGKNYTFGFDRLGGRLPTLLISPWVDKGFVEQQGVNTAGNRVSYSSSSLLRTLGYLWDFEPFTPRVDSALSFHHLIRASRREDTPSILPTPSPFVLRS